MTTTVRSLTELRAALRRARGADTEQLLAAKVGLLNRWFASEGLDSAVVGVSGGVDSAVVAGLLAEAARAARSPIRRVVALSIPIDGPGATGQPHAAARARRVTEALGVEHWDCPLGAVHADLVTALRAASGIAGDDWAAGQMLSVERTPVLYGAVALLRSAGHRAVVVGTTNRDEGAYLGFFGKASDGMVDVQPISDLHKSEVVALARRLGVPDEVVGAEPRGDVWDGRTDAEMIGAGYDDVEVVLRLLELAHDPRRVAATLSDGAGLVAAYDAVERLHRVNRHKYRDVGSPAVHLDVLPRCVPGGWADPRNTPRTESPPPNVPGRWDPPTIALDEPRWPAVAPDGGVIVADGVLTPADCERLVAALAGAPSQPVGVTGIVASAGVGSVRSTAFSAELAADLGRRVGPAVPSVRFLGPLDASEGHRTATRPGHRTWRAVGVSPLLRFMRYQAGGRHLCHYDAAYEYPDGRRTLLSLVLFLTGDGGADGGGALRFVRDGQERLPVWERDHRDWSDDTDPAAVVREVFPRAGTAVLFDHRRCHDVALWTGATDRVIVRADVVYEPVDDGRDLG